jgi:hypothetical protein
MDSRTQRIRALNDQLRQNLATGVAVMTPGVAALGEEAAARIIKTIAVFDDFCHANDPHEEHDFGSFEAAGVDPRFYSVRRSGTGQHIPLFVQERRLPPCGQRKYRPAHRQARRARGAPHAHNIPNPESGPY